MASLIGIATFTATVALANSFAGLAEGGLNFDIEEAARSMAVLAGEPVAAIASEVNVPLTDPGLIAQLIGALLLALPASLAMVVFSR
ncbi:MAG: hypothetical protein AAFQ42_07020 [Pseudomonadota bacterium]